MTQTEQYILNTLQGGEIVSLFQFAVESHMDYSHLLQTARRLEHNGLIRIYKNPEHQGQPLTLRLCTSRSITQSLTLKLAELEN